MRVHRPESSLRTVGVLLALLLVAPTALAGGLAVERTRIVDDGDQDGFADTNETIQLFLTVHNTSGSDLTNVRVTLSSDSPLLRCVTRDTIQFESLAPGVVTELGTPFEFAVGDVDRAASGMNVHQDFSVAFDVQVASDELFAPTDPATLVVPLDLDAVGGSGASSFFEGFESGDLGAFSVQNLDSQLNDPASADGTRCQYVDPDWIASNSYGVIVDCYPGDHPTHADAVFWHVDGPAEPWGGRGFGGTHSLHFGIDLGGSEGYTTPAGVMEAVVTTAPINLGWDRVCETTRTTTCTSAQDCPPGEGCVEADPMLSIKHQVDFLDDRSIGAPLFESADRGVVMAQLADAFGDQASDWMRVEPHRNVYDQRGSDNYSQCTFDPVDDGSTEDDFFDPADPDRRFGPSSTCFPVKTYTRIGDTFSAFDPERLGYADGPGLAGSSGPGTWIESRFNLQQFRGQRIRLRFLASGLQVGATENWESLFVYNPTPGDDGWFLDDVTVQDTLSQPATLFPDTHVNGTLPAATDGDGDGISDTCDNCASGLNPGQADGDADGVGDLCDNCPVSINEDQLDTDGDGLGDACDPCPSGDLDDGDGDGFVCTEDNCPSVFNAGQFDSDGDGRGDACDPCPLDAKDDEDGDGLCAGADNCVTRHNPDQGPAVRVSTPLTDGGDVDGFPFYRITSDGARLVYRADGDEDQRFELYSLPLDGGASMRLNGDLVDGGDVDRNFLLSPDGAWTVYLADQNVDGIDELFGVPTAGGTALRLSGDLVAGGGISRFGIDPTSSRVVYLADQDTDDKVELFSVPIDGGAPVRLNPALVAEGDVVDFAFTPDGATVVLRADDQANHGFRLLRVPVAGGTAEAISGTDVFSAQSFLISADGGTVVFEASELFSVPLAGGVEPTQISTMQVSGYAVAPSSTSVVYNDFNSGLYWAPIQGGAEISLTIGSTVDWIQQFAFTPDSSHVVYIADLFQSGRYDLLSIKSAGGTLTPLNGSLPVTGDVRGFVFAPDGQTVVYWADQDTDETLEIYAVPYLGGVAPIKLNAPLVPDGDVTFELDFTPDASKVIYQADLEVDDRFEIYEAPLTGGASNKLNAALIPDGDAGTARVTPDGAGVVYRADQLGNEKFELFALRFDPDADGDGTFDLCDVCPGIFDPDQTDVDGDRAGAPCDCNDAEPTIYPGAPELCNGIDDDCDLLVPAAEIDDDLDLFSDCEGDCDDDDATIHPGAPEINDGLDNQCDGDAGFGLVDELGGLAGFYNPAVRYEFSWPAQPGATSYEAARALTPQFSPACLAVATSDLFWVDVASPAPGGVIHYLVRPLAPSTGSWGGASPGVERTPACP
ncbi:MAG: hypothetical protein GY716_17140 [bacterium]|nr:hypothetical protein [bacterium]